MAVAYLLAAICRIGREHRGRGEGEAGSQGNDGMGLGGERRVILHRGLTESPGRQTQDRAGRVRAQGSPLTGRADKGC